ncbi:MAG: ABC transporter substrate-binding protein [Nocardioidaceae bacterium]
MKKLLLLLLAAVLATAGLTACGGTDEASDADADGAAGKTVLKISYQDVAFPALIEASGVLDDADFEVEWSNLTGPAANLQALYSGAIDLGHMGDTSLTIEQANADTEWTTDNAPLKIVAGWRNDYDPEYDPLITAVRTDAGIDSLADLKGHTWGYNFGGYNHAQYLVSIVKAGLTEKDVKGTEFADGATSAAAFNDGQVDVYSGGHGAVSEAIAAGDAKVLLTSAETGVPALNVWTATKEVLADPDKDAALKDFFSRLSGYWAWHDENPDKVKEILKTKLKIDDARADFEYEVRSGAFRLFDDELMTQEQDVAQALYDGGAIDKLPDVSIGFDDRYNTAQKAVSEADVKAGS